MKIEYVDHEREVRFIPTLGHRKHWKLRIKLTEYKTIKQMFQAFEMEQDITKKLSLLGDIFNRNAEVGDNHLQALSVLIEILQAYNWEKASLHKDKIEGQQ